MKKIKFIKQFSSPVLGNVWIGRTLECKDYDKYIRSGLAELVSNAEATQDKLSVKVEVDASKAIEDIKQAKKELKNGVNQSRRGKKSSKGR